MFQTGGSFLCIVQPVFVSVCLPVSCEEVISSSSINIEFWYMFVGCLIYAAIQEFGQIFFFPLFAASCLFPLHPHLTSIHHCGLKFYVLATFTNSNSIFLLFTSENICSFPWIVPYFLEGDCHQMNVHTVCVDESCSKPKGAFLVWL